jgi:hypothetical protein
MQQVNKLNYKLELSVEKSHLVYTLLYFDIFNYPLKYHEISSFFGANNYSQIHIQSNLKELCNDGFVCHEDGYYFICDNNKDIIKRRKIGNLKAQFMMQKAYRFSRLISWFPFVQCVCLSGSLSKAYMDETGDIDYFIITKPERLWIARTLLIAYKKIFLFDNRKYFCVNYFLDTDNLEIPDKNIFTATELLTLVPMYNGKLYKDLIEKNGWAKEYLPNHEPIDFNCASHGKINFLKKSMEFLLNGKLGDVLDTYFMKLTLKRWSIKFGHFTPDNFEHAMRTRKYVSKHHPQNFQQRVLNALEKKLSDFEDTYQVHLNLKHG